MKRNKKDLDAIIDNAARAIRDDDVESSIISESATRVWERVSHHALENPAFVTSNLESLKMNPSNNTEHIRGCDDFQSLIPAYLDGKLSTARTLLLEDHSNECIPCRREIKAQRDAAVATPEAAAAYQTSPAKLGGFFGGLKFNNALRWGFAAVAIAALGFGGLFMFERLDLSGRTLAATVENSDGLVYVVADDVSRPLVVGQELQKGETVRTAKDSNALLKLADGSTVEMRERSEFSVTENMRGVTVHLDRGDVIVEAAKQHNGRLYVQTPDSLVSVKGTIFAVESGTKGSRVSVVEGEVKVDHGGNEVTLLPGDQTTTNASLDKKTVQQNVAWSRKASKYAGLVSDLAKLRHDVNQKTPRPGIRYNSRFVDLVPENTVFYAALPNLSETLAESQRIMQERIRQNPALAEWWKGHKDDGLNGKVVDQIHELGSQLGEEIVLTARMDAKGEPSDILVLGELRNAAGFRSYVDGQISKFAKESKGGLNIRIIDDPMTVAPMPEKSVENAPRRPDLFVWIVNDIFAASPRIESLRGFASTMNAPGANKFAISPFHDRIVDVYRDGAGLIVAADLEKIVGIAIGQDKSVEGDRRVEGLKQLGVTNLRDFVVEQKDVAGRTLSRAALTFSEPNRGIASWLAAPGPMGALDFISPNANVATAFVVKEPALLVDDLLGFIETVQPELRAQMQELEKQQGISIRNDFAAPLGGEFAFAIDGPVLPTPSWKIVMEVYDQPKLQATFQRAIEKLNQFSTLHGKRKLTLESAVSGDRTYYSVRSDFGLEVHYTYVDGYLVGAPSRALLQQAISNREAGNTLVRSARFISSLPQDGNTNFSAILYHDLAPLLKQLPDSVKSMGSSMPEKDQQKLAVIDVNAPPTLAYAYSQGNRIVIGADTEGGAFGLSPASLLGMPHSFQMQKILMNAMGDKDVQKKE